MRLLKTHRQLLVILSCLSLVSSGVPAVHAATPAAPQANVSQDVRLDSQGRLRGQLVDRQGKPLPNSLVILQARGKQLSQVQTNHQGDFSFDGLRGGIYQVAGADAGGIYRVWTPNSAPPACKDAVLLVSGDALRGQNRCRPNRQMGIGAGHYNGAIMRSLNNPWLFGTAIAAGIAVPIIITNNDDESGS
ncbi:MAG: carboxypeptidase-like regulatory domain-containing protein [Pirellulaceae bacterium]|nr:carboxypeptidase-like regulatory domain-containing protein [Pirellulaceae bacterium]